MNRSASPPITLENAACPYCGVIQEPPPQRRRKCKDCGEIIHIHTDRAAATKYLLTETQAKRVERQQQDARWKELSKLVQTASQDGDLNALASAYDQQASILFDAGRPHHHVAREAMRCSLLAKQQLGISQVKVSTSQDERVCAHCQSLEGKVFSVDEALASMPLPGPSCTDGSDRNGHGGRCRCIYVAVIPEAGG